MTSNIIALFLGATIGAVYLFLTVQAFDNLRQKYDLSPVATVGFIFLGLYAVVAAISGGYYYLYH